MNLLIKPASGLCNMRCSYCFYADEMEQREQKTYGIMSVDTLEAIVKKAIAYSEKDGFVGLTFQGGEPTLAGLPFYRALIRFLDTYNTHRLPVRLGLQTNGYLIDDEWAQFLAKHQFLVGLSIDGTRDVHDFNRTDANGKGTFQQVLRAAELFRKYNVTYNTVTVVTRRNARAVTSIYQFFKKHGMTWQQYIPCLDPLGCYENKNLTPAQYGQFLCRLFDLWYHDFMSGIYIYNRTFENYVAILMGLEPEECGMCGHCTVQFVLEADGSVFPCDFYVLDGYKLGNFVTDPLEELLDRAAALQFVEDSYRTDEACRACKYFPLCRGGCRRHREPFEHGISARNRFCEAYRMFFDHAADRLVQLSYIAKQRQQASRKGS